MAVYLQASANPILSQVLLPLGGCCDHVQRRNPADYRTNGQGRPSRLFTGSPARWSACCCDHDADAVSQLCRDNLYAGLKEVLTRLPVQKDNTTGELLSRKR